MRTIPAVGKIIEDKTFNSVDFPAPLGPIIPTNSPSSTVNEILSNTSVLLFKRPYVLLTWFTSTIFHFSRSNVLLLLLFYQEKSE